MWQSLESYFTVSGQNTIVYKDFESYMFKIVATSPRGQWVKHVFIYPGDYLNTDLVYEDISDVSKLKRQMNEMLDDYNNVPGMIRMDLVLFKDAIEHGKW